MLGALGLTCVFMLVVGSAGLVSLTAAPKPGDVDGDGVTAGSDNCDEKYNPDQGDHDGDGAGDRCDLEPGVPAGSSFVTAYPRGEDGDPDAGGCVVWTQYAGGEAESPVNTCDRSFQTRLFEEGVERIDVEVVSPAGCGGRRTATFFPEPGTHHFFDPCPDLEVAVSPEREVAGAGEPLTYRLAVLNNGEAAASGVTLVDTLPAGFEYQSATPEGTCSETAGTVTCRLGMLEGLDEAWVEIVAVAGGDAGVYANETQVRSSDGDSSPANNFASAEVTVGVGADVAVHNGVTSVPEPNQDVEFTITVWNDGPQAAHGVTVADTLGANSRFVSATPSQGSCAAPSAQEVTCSLGTVAVSDFVAIEVVATGLTTDGVIRTSASVASTGPADPDGSNNRDSDAAMIGLPEGADLWISKLGPEYATVGEPYTYEVLVYNNGPATARSIRMTDPLPAGMAFQNVTAEGAGCRHATGTVTCELGDVTVDDFAFIEITVVPSEAGARINTASVAAAGGPADPDPDSDSSSTGTTIDPAPRGDPQPQPAPQPPPQPPPQPQPQPEPQPQPQPEPQLQPQSAPQPHPQPEQPAQFEPEARSQPRPETRQRPNAKRNKVALCHRGRTLKVLRSQVEKHRRHGDRLGKCKPKATNNTKKQAKRPRP